MQLIEAVTAEPNNARALAALGKLREDAGETQQALANYQRSLQLNPNQPQLASRVVSLSMPHSPSARPADAAGRHSRRHRRRRAVQ